jgi:hypothetical protein
MPVKKRSNLQQILILPPFSSPRSHRVLILERASASLVKCLGGPLRGSHPGQFHVPYDLVVDKAALYVSDQLNHRCQVRRTGWEGSVVG